jgi:hypothetical protein
VEIVDSFQILEKDSQPTLVVSDDDRHVITGRVTLAGNNTSADLETDTYLGRETTEEGWFDISLRQSNTSKILLHNSIRLQTADSPFHHGHWRQSIFPNVVVLDSQHLDDKCQVAKISFRLEKLGYFFRYETIEEHHLGDSADDFLAFLKRLREDASTRYDFSRAATDYDFEAPREIVVVHESPEEIRFQVGNNTYSVFIGYWSGGGVFNSVNMRHEPIASIEFDEPLSLDDAINAVWVWRRFFHQIAFGSLSLIGLSATGQASERPSWARLYLPNEREYGERKTTSSEFHPSDVPLSNWKQRGRLIELMSLWLEGEGRHSRFRVFLDHVLQEHRTSNSLDHVTMLCSAIESIPDLVGPKSLNKDLLTKVADAAHAKAESLNLGISVNRFKGIIGQLANAPLSDRIRTLISSVANNLSEAQTNNLIRHTMRLRTLAAHGNASEPLRQPVLPPVIQALTALCVLYDLKTSGLTDADDQQNIRLIARGRLKYAVDTISELAPKK